MIKKFQTYITPFNDERTVHLYLPDDYDNSDERYPAIYMYDGHNLYLDEDATYGKSWGFNEFFKVYDKSFIMVGIECNHEGNERLNEYCPYICHSSYLGDLDGRGDIFMQWVVDELKPYIDNHYRTYASRECTMIGGSSMGGLMAFYTVVKHNNIFSKAACLSSSIGLCMDDLKAEIARSAIDPDTRVYMDWGSEESRNKTGLAYNTSNNLELSHLINLKGGLTYPHLVLHGQHCEASWEKQIPIFMDYLWK